MFVEGQGHEGQASMEEAGWDGRGLGFTVPGSQPFPGIVFSRVLLHSGSQDGDRWKAGIDNRAVSLQPRVGDLQQVVVPRKDLDLLPCACPNQWDRARSDT